MTTTKRKKPRVLPASEVTTPTEPPNPEVKQAFDEAGSRVESGQRQLAKKLTEHHSQSPVQTAGDIDAAWDRSDVGEESPGGSVATPDQAVVDEIGEALGVTFEDNEPVDLNRKLRRRDHHRWELNPASSPDFKERQRPPE